MNRRELMQMLASASAASVSGLPHGAAAVGDGAASFDEEQPVSDPGMLRHQVPSLWRPLCDQLDLIRMSARQLSILSGDSVDAQFQVEQQAFAELSELCLRGMERLAAEIVLRRCVRPVPMLLSEWMSC